MAVICLYFFNSSILCSSSPYSVALNFFPSYFNGEALEKNTRGERGRRRRTSNFVVLSTHSNPRILKSNKKSRYGQTLSPYNSDEDSEEDDRLSDDEFMEMEDIDTDSQSFYPVKETNTKPGSRKPKGSWEERSLENGQSMKMKDSQLAVKHVKNTIGKRSFGDAYHASDRFQEIGSIRTDSRGKLKTKAGKSMKGKFHQLSEELDLDEKWFPLLDYLSSFGFKDSHFIQIYERHMPSLQINVASAQERLEFLLSIGVKHRDIRKILLRQPQILGYTVESNLKSHVAFLVSLGIPDSRIGQIITAAPSLLSYSVEHSLKPTVRYLVEEVGIKRSDLSKVVQLSPQILVQRIDNSWKTRFGFLSKELGAPRDNIVKMVRKHPQLLHYSIEDGILPRINFLRSIGMRNSDILKVLTSITQVLSLSLEDNLKPKYLYLVNDLRNEVQSLTKYPMYLSLSLDQRIRPRHRFLVSLKKAPKGPFPLSSFVPTDECFCHQWAGTSLDKYLAFRQSLLLKDFAKKYGRK